MKIMDKVSPSPSYSFPFLVLMIFIGCREPYEGTSDASDDVQEDAHGECRDLAWEGDYLIRTSSDMNEISGYRSITGNLFVSGSDLTNISGLECLETIERNLIIDHNDDLTTLDGLGSLGSANTLSIAQNESLINIDSLSSVTNIEGNLVIYSNEILQNLDGLRSLSSLGGDINIQYNFGFPDCEGEVLRDGLNGHGWTGEAVIQWNGSGSCD